MWRWRRTVTTTDSVLCDRSGTLHGRVCELGFAVRGSGLLQGHFFRHPKANAAPDKA